MPVDQPPMQMERVLEIPPNATVQLLSGTRVVTSIAVPPGPARVTIQYFVPHKRK